MFSSRFWNDSSRRSFLRSACGAALSLPWLESVSAWAGEGRDASAGPQRLAFYYVPIGVIRRGFFPGEELAVLPKFTGPDTKASEGAVFTPGVHPLDLTPSMRPLRKLKDKITLITGMDRTFQNGTDVHAQCASCFLSSAAPFSVKSSAWPLDRTLDHIVADKIGVDRPFRTLELSCNSHRDNRESIYFDNISWYGTGHVAPSLRDPRKTYQRLFGTQDIEKFRNITDLVLEDAKSLRSELGYADRAKFAEYFESIRSIETQMDRLQAMKSELAQVQLEEPPESHLPRRQYMRLMGDLMVVALQTGLTHVATFMVGPERWDTPMMYDGVFDKPINHHMWSHNPKNFVKGLLKLDLFHIEQFAYIAEKMDSVKESDGKTLLDNTIFTFGSGLGDGSTHQYTDLPIIVAGRGGGRIRSGVHLHCSNGTPLANLWLTHARSLGVEMDRFADSSGVVKDLMA